MRSQAQPERVARSTVSCWNRKNRSYRQVVQFRAASSAVTSSGESLATSVYFRIQFLRRPPPRAGSHTARQMFRKCGDGRIAPNQRRGERQPQAVLQTVAQFQRHQRIQTQAVSGASRSIRDAGSRKTCAICSADGFPAASAFAIRLPPPAARAGLSGLPAPAPCPPRQSIPRAAESPRPSDRTAAIAADRAAAPPLASCPVALNGPASPALAGRKTADATHGQTPPAIRASR